MEPAREGGTDSRTLLVAGLLFVPIGFGSLWAITPRAQPLPVVQLKILDGVDRSYAGRYANDPRFIRMMDDLSALRTEMVSELQKRTGLAYDDPDDFVIAFRDLAAGIGATSRPVRPRGSLDNPLDLITLAPTPILQGQIDARRLVTHELIHAVMRKLMGADRYRALPIWIREGVAVWGAGQLKERLRSLVMAAFEPAENPQVAMAEVFLRLDPNDAYLWGAAMLEYIQQNEGEDRVRRIIAEIMAGQDVQQAFERASELEWKDLVRVNHQFCQMLLEGAVFETGLLAFGRAQVYYERGDLARASEQLRAMLEGPFDDLLKPSAWYWLGRLQCEAGETDAARLAFQHVIDGYPDHRELVRESRARLRSCAPPVAVGRPGSRP